MLFYPNLPSKSDPRDLWPMRYLIRVMRQRYLETTLKEKSKSLLTITMTMALDEHPPRTSTKTFDIWDTDYISDNREQQSQHSLWPFNKEWQGQHSQFLRCLFLQLEFCIDHCSSIVRWGKVIITQISLLTNPYIMMTTEYYKANFWSPICLKLDKNGQIKQMMQHSSG